VLKEHVAKRYPFYEQADIAVDTGDHPHGRALDLVLDALYNHIQRTSS
jgi:hypothetical protein